MKIKIIEINFIALFLTSGLCGMQSTLQLERLKAQKEMLDRLACFEEQINNQIIAEATKCLSQLLPRESVDDALKKTLNRVLFRLARESDGFDVKELARILIEVGADPNMQYTVEEVLIIKEVHNFSTTAHSYNTTAKTEANGKLKEYFDSLQLKKN